MRTFRTILFALLILFLAGCSKKQTTVVVPAPTRPVVPAAEPKASPPPTPVPRIVLDDKTDADPYPLPRLVSGAFDHADLSDSMLDAFAERFCYDLFAPAMTLKTSDFSNYVEDNPSTHLGLRWGEYLMADAAKYPHKRIKAFTSVLSEHRVRENQDDFVRYQAMCEVRYDRTDPSVNGCNVDITITLAERDGALKIVALNLVFDSRYRDLLKRLTEQAGGEEKLTVEMIDKGFEKALKGI